VAIHSYSHEDVTSIKQISPSILDQLEQFFVSYNKLHGKKFKVTGRGGPNRALKIIKDGIKAFDKKKA
jgi:inorganic pyrophosphatase